MTKEVRNGGAVIDGHVHLYDCYNIQQFLSASQRNLSAAAQSLGCSPLKSSRRGGRVVEGGGLENREATSRAVSSCPASSRKILKYKPTA